MKLVILFAIFALAIAEGNTTRPVAFMHGMGDFADNPMGMVPFKKLMSEHLDTYVVNPKLGSWDITD